MHTQTIDWATFVRTYRPVPNPIDVNASFDIFMLETFGRTLARVWCGTITYVWNGTAIEAVYEKSSYSPLISPLRP